MRRKYYSSKKSMNGKKGGRFHRMITSGARRRRGRYRMKRYR